MTKIIAGFFAGGIIGIILSFFYLPFITNVSELLASPLLFTATVTGIIAGLLGNLYLSPLTDVLGSAAVGITLFLLLATYAEFYFQLAMLGLLTGALAGWISAKAPY